MSTEAKREAARIVVCAIDDWRARRTEGEGRKVEADVLLELEKVKGAFALVASLEPLHKPEGWTEGRPQIGECRCNACVDRKSAYRKLRVEP